MSSQFTPQQIAQQNAVFQQALANKQITQQQYNDAMKVQSANLTAYNAAHQTQTVILPADFVGPPGPNQVQTPTTPTNSTTQTTPNIPLPQNPQTLLNERAVFESAYQSGQINNAEYNQAMQFNQQQLANIGYNVTSISEPVPRPTPNFVGPMPTKVTGFAATPISTPSALEEAKQQQETATYAQTYPRSGGSTNPLANQLTDTGQTIQQQQIIANLTPQQKTEFSAWKQQKTITSMTNLGTFLAAGAIAPAIGPVAATSSALLGVGINQGFKTVQGGGLLTPQEALNAAETGIIFSGVGKAAYVGIGASPLKGLIQGVGQGTTKTVSGIAGHTVVNAGIGAGAGIVVEGYNTGKITGQGAVEGAAFGAAFGLAGEAGQGFRKINTRFGITDYIGQTRVGSKVSEVMSNINEKINGVSGTGFVEAREIMIEKTSGSTIKVNRIMQVETEPIHVSRQVAEQFRSSNPNKINLVGTETTRTFISPKEFEPDFSVHQNEMLQVTSGGKLGPSGVRTGQVRISDTTLEIGKFGIKTPVDINRVIASESDMVVSNELLRVGQPKAADAYLKQNIETNPFEQTRQAQPFLSSVKGEKTVQTKTLIGDMRELTDTSKLGLSKGMADIVYNTDAKATTKLMTGKGSVGPEGTKDSGSIILTKEVEVIGKVPDNYFVSERTITDIQLEGTAKGSKLPIPKNAGQEAPNLGSIKETEYAQDFSGVIKPKPIKAFEDPFQKTIKTETNNILKNTLTDLGEPTNLPFKYSEGPYTIKQQSIGERLHSGLNKFISNTQTRSQIQPQYENPYTTENYVSNKINDNFTKNQNKLNQGISLKEYNKVTSKNTFGESPFEGSFNKTNKQYEGYSKGSGTEKDIQTIHQLTQELPKNPIRMAPEKQQTTMLPKNLLGVAPKTTGISANLFSKTMSIAGSIASTTQKNVYNPYTKQSTKNYYVQQPQYQQEYEEITYLSTLNSRLKHPQQPNFITQTNQHQTQMFNQQQSPANPSIENSKMIMPTRNILDNPTKTGFDTNQAISQIPIFGIANTQVPKTEQRITPTTIQKTQQRNNENNNRNNSGLGLPFTQLGSKAMEFGGNSGAYPNFTGLRSNKRQYDILTAEEFLGY